MTFTSAAADENQQEFDYGLFEFYPTNIVTDKRRIISKIYKFTLTHSHFTITSSVWMVISLRETRSTRTLPHKIYFVHETQVVRRKIYIHVER